MISKSLGGPLVLERAICSDCKKITEKLDDFLANIFPPTLMARTDLGIRSYSKKQPEMSLVADDPKLGQVELLLHPIDKNPDITIKSMIRKDGDSLLAMAPTLGEALNLMSKATKRHTKLSDISEMGSILRSDSAKIKEPIDWEFAHRAVSKIFYCYILLELGDQILDRAPMCALRNHFLRGSDDSQIQPQTDVGREIEMAEGGKIEIPRHHHVLLFDSQEKSNNWVCLFGLFWFRFCLDLSELSPHGRLVGINPISRTLVESLTRYQGIWRFRTSNLWGWQQRLGTRYEIPMIRRSGE